jgi:hypothetical protein
MDTPSILDHRHSPAAIPIRESMREATRQTGKSGAAQLREMLQLAHGPGHLTPREYLYFGLYDDRQFSAADKRRFLGYELQCHILRRCTDPHWWAIGHDKIAFYALMQSYGLPVPRVVATLHPFRRLAGARPLCTTEEVVEFLRHEATYPLFSKPFDGSRSVGSARIDGYDPDADELVLHGERRVALAKYIDDIAGYLQSGYLFQEVAHPHEAVRSVCGDRVASVRFVLIVGDRGPEPFRAVWKIPAGPHIADNYWRKGNLLAGIDLDSGRVTQVMTGTGTSRTRVDRHPDTGVSFDGFCIPQWQELKELCLGAAATMPGITMQGWDIAPCAQGPMLIEVNIGGDFTLPQLANDTGLLDEQFREYLKRHRFEPYSSTRRVRFFVAGNVRAATSALRERVKRAVRRAPAG